MKKINFKLSEERKNALKIDAIALGIAILAAGLFFLIGHWALVAGGFSGIEIFN